MFFKKIFFFLFFISSVSIPGYYFYQRSKSKKEEEVQEEEIQEEKEDQLIKNEEVTLVEINGWLDWFLLNTIFYFLIFYLFLTLFKVRLDMLIMNEANKTTNEQLKDFFVKSLEQNNNDPFNPTYDLVCIDSITSKSINSIIDTAEKDYIDSLSSNKQPCKTTYNLKTELEELYMIQHCFKNDQFFDPGSKFLYYFMFNMDIEEMKFPITSSIILFIITHILLRYFLYFLMKSFWQVGWQKTFENLHWLDLFSIEKVFRRNSIVKKIIFLIAFILTTGFTFAWAFFKEYRPKARYFNYEVGKKLEKKLANRKFASCLPLKAEKEIKDKVSKIKPQQNKKNP